MIFSKFLRSYEPQCFQLQHGENNQKRGKYCDNFLMHVNTQLSQSSQQELLVPLLYFLK